MSGSKNKKFQPYKASTLDTPSFHFLFRPFIPLLYPFTRIIYSIRWLLSEPLQIRILPKWFPGTIPGLKFLPYITIGQIILTFPLVVLFFAGCKETFVTPNLKSSGHFASYALICAFLTASKSNSMISFFLGISFERMIPYHNLSSLLAVLLSIFHTYVAFVYGGDRRLRNRDRRELDSDNSQYGLYGNNPDFFKFCFDGWNNISGSLILGCLLFLIGTSFPTLRRWMYEFWLITHVGAAVGVIFFCIVHSVTLILLVALWWGFDVFLRYFILAVTQYPKKAQITSIHSEIVEIRFPKTNGFNYKSGQFVRIAVPAVSVFEFHPITISSAPHETDVTLHIRVLGGWTRKLNELAKRQNDIIILIEGPYGCVSVDLDNDSKYQMMIMVGGGIGITPCQSLTKSILHDHQNGRKLQKIKYVWAIRDKNMIFTSLSPPTVTRIEEDSDNDPLEENHDASMEATRELSYEGDVEVPSSCTTNVHSLNVLEADIYVTAKNNSDNDDPLITPFNMHYGSRPDFDCIFEEMKHEAELHRFHSIAVVGCGPTQMLEELREACRKYSAGELECGNGGGVKFDLHEEMFDF